MDISLIIPCYNEEGNIKLFFEETEKVFGPTGYSYEYVFVNDGSHDDTKVILETLFRDNPEKNIVVINFSRNFGKEAAIYAGLKNVSGDNICIIDADLQQHPSVALGMYQKMIKYPEYDCVCAYQKKRKENRIISGLKSAFYKIINGIAEIEFKNGASDFRFFNRKVKDAMLLVTEYHRFSKGIFSWLGFNVLYIEYEAEERNSGVTKWGTIKLFKYALNGIMAFSTAPLRVSIFVGSGSIIFSIIYFVVTIIRKFTYSIDVDGFTQIVLLITFFSGILLFTIGIIGEYIALIYQQVKQRPLYIVDDILKK